MVLAAAGIAVAGSLALVAPETVHAQREAAQSSLTPVPGAPASFADLVARVKPSVVSIQVESSDNRTRMMGRRPSPRSGAKPFPDLPDDHPLNEFFRGLPRGEQGPQARPRQRRQAQGSGFVISADGYVVTNNHVISGAEKINVSFDEKEQIPAKLIGTDPRTDLALLKIQSDKTFPFVSFADKISREGDWVVAVGNPFGLGGTVTAGIISALSRDIGSGPYDFIQIDAAVNRGNSGGPTFNLKGEVIGVNTAIYSPSGGNVGIAFAVPAQTAVEVINELKKSGSVKRGWLGVKIQSITDDMAEGLGLKQASGALVSEVTQDSPAAKAGLEPG
ncbi:MAG: trypsin-like peptidase domain-containing protein, partial [Alphaproteobacteria bacterium]|nr:trypsin-like peptidase domain-containing protein [Alphaproteobacteria bacterium]